MDELIRVSIPFRGLVLFRHGEDSGSCEVRDSGFNPLPRISSFPTR